MDLSNITILTVNYNSTELTTRLINSIMLFYPDSELKIHIVDGSDNKMYIDQMKTMCTQSKYNNRIILHTLGYNIHHGTGMMYGLNKIDTDYVLILDNDVYLTAPNIIELLFDKTIELSSLSRKFLFIGCQMLIDENGKAVVNKVRDYHKLEKIMPSSLINNHANINTDETSKIDIKSLIKYIHPSFMFTNRKLFLDHVNREILRPFIKHGAPCITTMYDIKKHGMEHMLIDMTDILMDYYIHDWNGVVKSSGGYHLSTQHHFGNVNSYTNISHNIDNYLKEQKQYDQLIENEDIQHKAQRQINESKKFAHLKGKRKLNTKELKKLNPIF